MTTPITIPKLHDIIGWILDSQIPTLAAMRATNWCSGGISDDPTQYTGWTNRHRQVFAIECLIMTQGKRENAKRVAEHNARALIVSREVDAFGDQFTDEALASLYRQVEIDAGPQKIVHVEPSRRSHWTPPPSSGNDRELERLRKMEAEVLGAFGDWPGGSWSPTHLQRLQALTPPPMVLLLVCWSSKTGQRVVGVDYEQERQNYAWDENYDLWEFPESQLAETLESNGLTMKGDPEPLPEPDATIPTSVDTVTCAECGGDGVAKAIYTGRCRSCEGKGYTVAWPG
jgi:hypothetical protein